MPEQPEQLDLLAHVHDDDARAILDQARDLFTRLGALPEGPRMDLINQLRLELHQHSPMREEPVDCVLWVPAEQVRANDYNPNVVAPPEMDLLAHSITADGYTQPIVTWPSDDAALPEADRRYEVVDGFHRLRVGKENADVRARVKGRLPITAIRPERSEKPNRVAATVRHNVARGKHTIEGEAEIVLYLARVGKSDEWIAEHLGMDRDKVLKLKHEQSLLDAFADQEFSEAWEPDHEADDT